MRRVERTAHLTAPPEEVFAVVSDLDQLAAWQTGVLSAERTSPGDMGIGATAHVARQVMGQRLDAPLTVTDYDPPRRLTLGTEVSGIRALADLWLEAADDGGTDLTFAMEFQGSMLTAFMEPMIASAAGGDIDASLARLQERFAPSMP
jgi:carbon monoxide dehydrogenase subunit G